MKEGRERHERGIWVGRDGDIKMHLYLNCMFWVLNQSWSKAAAEEPTWVPSAKHMPLQSSSGWFFRLCTWPCFGLWGPSNEWNRQKSSSSPLYPLELTFKWGEQTFNEITVKCIITQRNIKQGRGIGSVRDGVSTGILEQVAKQRLEWKDMKEWAKGRPRGRALPAEGKGSESILG